MLKKLIFPKLLQRLEETRWDGRACLKGFLWIEGMYSKPVGQAWGKKNHTKSIKRKVALGKSELTFRTS